MMMMGQFFFIHFKHLICSFRMQFMNTESSFDFSHSMWMCFNAQLENLSNALVNRN